ncbi:LemA family protein [bacterium]|nr:LemA family protein [bacterium]
MGSSGKIGCVVLAALAALAVVLVLVFVGIRNNLVTLDEEVGEAWAQVQNVYQRRYDLIPNLVETVKGYASHERETLQAVIEARSKVGGITQLNSQDLTPENLARFQQAQAGLSGALQRLMVVIERYPDLKANQNFLALQDELAGTENRIAVERRRFNEKTRIFNSTIRKIPQTFVAGMLSMTPKPYFEADQQAQAAPKVEF